MPEPAGQARNQLPVCPIDVFEGMIDTFSEMGRIFVSGIRDSAPVSPSLARSVSSAIEANGVLFDRFTEATRRMRAPREQAASTNRPADGTGGQTSMVVLQGAPGEEASGAFLLQNLRQEPVKATVLPTGFVNVDGERVDVELRLAPSRVVLDANEETVVEVMVSIPDDLPEGQQLQGAIHVPGLTTALVPVLIRTQLPEAAGQ
jgi:hypothetical protein